MIKTGVFIRNDDRLKDVIDYLYSNTDLKYIVFKDECFNQSVYYKYKETNTICMSHQEFKNLINSRETEELDYIFSYYYQRRFENIILKFPNRGCINFHPAPLPYYRGVGNYSKCILEELNYWGVSAHFMDEKYDNGKIIQVLKFNVNSNTETYIGLENRTYKYMYKLFCNVVKDALNNDIQIQNVDIDESKISYLTRNKINKLKKINDGDTPKEIELKIRAFWCPPYPGATISIDDKNYTVIDNNILEELVWLYKKRYKEVENK